MENRVDVVLTPEQMEAVKAGLASLGSILDFAVPLTGADRVALLKLGDKSVAFVNKSLEAAKAHPGSIPPAVKVDELERDVKLYDQLNEIARRLATLQRAVEDTAMVAGSEAYQAALQVYGFLQAGVKFEPGLGEVVNELGRRFRRQRARGGSDTKGS